MHSDRIAHVPPVSCPHCSCAPRQLPRQLPPLRMCPPVSCPHCSCAPPSAAPTAHVLPRQLPALPMCPPVSCTHCACAP
eukprot:73994-Prorocentrum_minimum.AAC.1